MAELEKDTNYAGVAAPTNLRAPVSAGDAVPLSYANGNLGGLPLAAAAPNPGDIISWNGTSWVYRSLVAAIDPLPVGAVASTGSSSFLAPIDHVHVGSNSGTSGDAQEIVMGAGVYSPGPVDISPTSTAGAVINEINSVMSLLLPAEPPTLAQVTPSIPSLFTASISSGTSNMGSYTAGSLTSSVTFSSPVSITYSGFGPADEGILVYSNFSFNLQTAFDATFRITQQGSTYDGGQGIPVTDSIFTINSIARQANYAGYQIGSVTVDYIPEPGSNDFTLSQIVSSSTTESEPVSIWYDNGIVPDAPVSTVSLSNLVQNITSGIPHIGMGSVLSFVTPYTSGIFNNTYNEDGSFAILTGPAIPATSIGIGTPGILGVTQPIPDISDAVSFNGVQVTLTRLAALTDASWGLSITTPRGVSPVTNSTGQVSSATFNINTYPIQSTLSTESFTDEQYRLPSGGASSSPSVYSTLMTASDLATSHLSVNWHNAVDSSELILLGGGLCYANMNLATCSPAGPNYQNRSGWQGYTRYWELDQKSNATITISESALFAPGFTLQVKLPGVTGWLNVLSQFIGGTPSSDGDGCLVGGYTPLLVGGYPVDGSSVTIPITFGLNSTSMSNNFIITRIGATGYFKPATLMSIS